MSVNLAVQTTVHSDTAQLPRFDRVAVHGCGAVGSALIELLTRIHALRSDTALWLCDTDMYEMKNFGTQLIEAEFVGLRKDHAMAQKCRMRGVSVAIDTDFAIARMLANSGALSATFVQTDSMRSRNTIWQKYCDHRFTNRSLVYIDTRVGWDHIEIHGFRPYFGDMRDRYKETLYSDDQAQQEVCGRRMSFATAVIAAGLALRTSYQLLRPNKKWVTRIIALDDVGVVPEEFFQKEDE